MAAASSSSSSSPILSAAHRRRLNDVDSDGGHRGHGAGAAGVKALFSVRRNSKRASVVDQAWMRNAVACLLCLAVAVRLLSSHRGGNAGGKLVQRVDVGDGEVLGWREENLTAVVRRPPDPTRRVGPLALRGPRVCTQENLRSFMAGVQDFQVAVAVLYFSCGIKLDTHNISVAPEAALPSVSLSMNRPLVRAAKALPRS